MQFGEPSHVVYHIPLNIRRDFPGTLLYIMRARSTSLACIEKVVLDLCAAGPDTAAVFYTAALDMIERRNGTPTPTFLCAITKHAPRPFAAWPVRAPLFILHHLCTALRAIQGTKLELGSVDFPRIRADEVVFRRSFFSIHALRGFVLPCLIALDSSVVDFAIATVSQLAQALLTSVQHNPPHDPRACFSYADNDARLQGITDIIVQIYACYSKPYLIYMHD